MANSPNASRLMLYRWFIPGVAVGTSPRSDADAASRDRPPTASGDREPFAQGLVEGESGSSGSAGEKMPKTPLSHIRARPWNTSAGKHQASTIQLTNREMYFLGCALERRPHASTQIKNIKNHTGHAMCIASLSFHGTSFCRQNFSGSPDLTLHSTFSLEDQDFARIMVFHARDLAIRRRSVGPIICRIKVRQKGQPQKSAKSTLKVAKLEPKIGPFRTSDGARTPRLTAVFMPHQPTKVMMTTSIVEPSLIEPTSVAKCPEQVHQREGKIATTAREDLGSDGHQHLNFEEVHRLNLKHSVMKNEDMKDHIIQNMCLNFGKHNNKFDNLFVNNEAIWNMFMKDCM